MGVTMVLAIVGTVAIGLIVKLFLGLRSSQEEESAGLDISDHGEEGYIVNR